MPRLSIVIPCLGEAAEFEDALVSVLQHRPADCEVIVAHAEPYSDPYALRGEVHFVEEQADSTAELLNAALDVATGEIVHVLGCEFEATEGWTEAALKHFDDPDVAALSPLVVGADGQAAIAAGIRWSRGGARHIVKDQRVVSRGSARLRANILGPLLTAAFYRRDVLVALEGFETALGDELADVGVGLAIQNLGRLHRIEPASRLIQSNIGSHAIASGFATGRSAERVFFRHAAAHGLLPALLLHVFTIGGEAVRHAPRYSLASLFGRLAAWFEIGALHRYEQRLESAGTRLAEVAELRATLRSSKRRPLPKADVLPSRQRRAA